MMGAYVEADLDLARVTLERAIAWEVPSIHAGAIAWARRELERERVPRAVILAGDPSVRKREMAMEEAWLDVMAERARTTPNLRLVKPPQPENDDDA